ncbi:Kinase [Hexamita inflata]|uniref:Kinase n=1 Tax=Hexamita inflata TaxID=28002 RepID=A0AA86P7E2_9EUKA|nr:Kinase [Hexamita inflata]
MNTHPDGPKVNVDWEDPEMMSTIQMNPKLLAAMAGRLGAGQNPYQRPQYGYNPYKAPVPQSNNNVSDVQKALPEPEYEKRKQFELLQKVHDDRAKRSQQVDNGSQERARSENTNPFAKENISQPQVKPQSYVQTTTRPGNRSEASSSRAQALRPDHEAADAGEEPGHSCQSSSAAVQQALAVRKGAELQAQLSRPSAEAARPVQTTGGAPGPGPAEEAGRAGAAERGEEGDAGLEQGVQILVKEFIFIIQHNSLSSRTGACTPCLSDTSVAGTPGPSSWRPPPLRSRGSSGRRAGSRRP